MVKANIRCVIRLRPSETEGFATVGADKQTLGLRNRGSDLHGANSEQLTVRAGSRSTGSSAQKHTCSSKLLRTARPGVPFSHAYCAELRRPRWFRSSSLMASCITLRKKQYSMPVGQRPWSPSCRAIIQRRVLCLP